jgi:hypothetical protein
VRINRRQSRAQRQGLMRARLAVTSASPHTWRVSTHIKFARRS